MYIKISAYFFIFILIICLFIYFTVLFGTKRIRTINDKKVKNIRPCPQFFIHRASIWMIANLIWTVIDYSTTIIAFLSPMMIIYLYSIDSILPDYIIFFSILASFMTIISFAVSPKEHIKAYRRAWKCLDTAINEYMYMSDTSQYDILNKAVEKGESYIDSINNIES